MRAEEREARGADPTGGGEAGSQAGHARTHARTVRATDRYRACQVRIWIRAIGMLLTPMLVQFEQQIDIELAR
jgi:hypothetical protein